MAAHCSAMVPESSLAAASSAAAAGSSEIERRFPLGGNRVLVHLVVTGHDL